MTDIAPEGDFMRWDGNQWIKDSDAERAAAVSHAVDEKNGVRKKPLKLSARYRTLLI